MKAPVGNWKDWLCGSSVWTTMPGPRLCIQVFDQMSWHFCMPMMQPIPEMPNVKTGENESNPMCFQLKCPIFKLGIGHQKRPESRVTTPRLQDIVVRASSSLSKIVWRCVVLFRRFLMLGSPGVQKVRPWRVPKQLTTWFNVIRAWKKTNHRTWRSQWGLRTACCVSCFSYHVLKTAPQPTTGLRSQSKCWNPNSCRCWFRADRQASTCSKMPTFAGSVDQRTKYPEA